jgi:hypothetical protein
MEGEEREGIALYLIFDLKCEVHMRTRVLGVKGRATFGCWIRSLWGFDSMLDTESNEEKGQRAV